MYRINPIDDTLLEAKKKKDEASLKYPKSFKVRVSTSKVNLDVIKEWTDRELQKLLPDDDIVIDYLSELLKSSEEPDIKAIHLQMKDFLGEKDSFQFCDKLWKMMISAQDNKDGVPSELLEEKKTNYNRSVPRKGRYHEGEPKGKIQENDERDGNREDNEKRNEARDEKRRQERYEKRREERHEKRRGERDGKRKRPKDTETERVRKRQRGW